MKKSRLITFLSLLLISCSSATKKEIAAEKEIVKEVRGRVDLQEKLKSLISTSTKLSEKQKGNFLTLHSSVIQNVDGINSEMGKLKIVLFNHLTGDHFDRTKVAELQKQLRKLYDKKFIIMINAMNEAREILGVHFGELYPLNDYRHQIYDKYR